MRTICYVGVAAALGMLCGCGRPIAGPRPMNKKPTPPPATVSATTPQPRTLELPTLHITVKNYRWIGYLDTLGNPTAPDPREVVKPEAGQKFICLYTSFAVAQGSNEVMHPEEKVLLFYQKMLSKSVGTFTVPYPGMSRVESITPERGLLLDRTCYLVYAVPQAATTADLSVAVSHGKPVALDKIPEANTEDRLSGAEQQAILNAEMGGTPQPLNSATDVNPSRRKTR